jgi:CRP-like cAMP-binding protein
MINAGSILGDADVLGRRTYRTRVEAVTPMTVWEIRAHDLDRLLVDAPTFARALARDLGRRLRAAEMSLAEAS